MFFLGRIVAVVLVSALFGIIVGFYSRKQNNRLNTGLCALVAGAFGALGALVLRGAYPVLFEHLWAGFTEIFTFVLTPYVVLFIPRSPWLIVLGFAAGLGLGNALESLFRKESCYSWIALCACLVAFSGTKLALTEPLPAGVTTVTRVLRFDDPRRNGWDEQSNHWVKFLENNSTAGFGYESFSHDYYTHLTGDHADSSEVIFLFSKEYIKDGQVIDEVKTVHKGNLTDSQLRAKMHETAASRRRIP